MVEAASTTTSPSSWPSFGLKQLVKQAEAARDEGKYLFIWDKNGQVEVFFAYKGIVSHFAKEIIRAKIGGEEDKTPVLEECRKQLILAMKNGDRLLIDFDNLCPDLTTDWTDEDTFKSELIFNRTEWLQPDNYLKYVRESENSGIAGLNPGKYVAHEDFSLNFRTSSTDEAEVTKLLSQIPHSQQFKCIIIE